MRHEHPFQADYRCPLCEKIGDYYNTSVGPVRLCGKCKVSWRPGELYCMLRKHGVAYDVVRFEPHDNRAASVDAVSRVME
jgi:hypothetical protein